MNGSKIQIIKKRIEERIDFMIIIGFGPKKYNEWFWRKLNKENNEEISRIIV